VRSDTGAIAVATNGALTLAAFEDQELLVGHDGAWRSHGWDRNRGRIVSVGVSVAGELFVGCLAEQPLVWRTNDGGRSWSVWLRCPRAPGLSLATGQEVLAASGTRVYRLLGATELPDAVTCITFGTTRGRVYAATTGGVHMSTDGAKQFTPWSEHLPELPVLALNASADEVSALLVGGSFWRRPL
jgi:photosystem II stability/assembly factor-like uncharacterized protein